MTIRRTALLTILATTASAPAVVAQAPLPVNLYVADISYRGATISIGTPHKITGDRGISSQPAFTPDGKSIVYISRRDSANAQSDVYRIDLATGIETRITSTPENENSPTVTPDGQLMVIRWIPATLFTEWGPWIYDMKGNPLRGVLPGPDTVGYYARVDANRIAMVRPKSRTTMSIFDNRTKTMTDYDLPVANLPPQLIPGQNAISYTRTDSLGRNQIRRLDLKTMDTSVIAPAVPGRIVHSWTPRGMILMAKGGAIYSLRPGSGAQWKQVAKFTAPDLQAMSMYVVSPAGDKVILISPLKPSLTAVLRDSIQAGVSLASAVKRYAAMSKAQLTSAFDFSDGALVGLGAEQTRRNFTADAIAVLNMAIALFPTSYSAQLALGDAFTKAGNTSAAAGAYRRSIDLNPNSTDTEKRDAERARLAISGSGRSLTAQDSDPDKLVSEGGVKAPGWTGRIDPRAAAQGRKLTDAKFVSMGAGIHVTAGPAAIYWNPANSPSGNYTVSATFNQTKASAHPEGYGLILAGRDLETPAQSYFYFLVRQDGKFLLNHRANDSTVHKIIDWAANDAVKAVDADGKASNKLSIVVGPEKLSFQVNGTEVHSLARSAIESGPMKSGSTGISGIRVNHNLDVHIDGFAVTSTK